MPHTDEIDTDGTDEIVCPHCGEVFTDSWEYGRDEDIGEVECGECEKTFYARRNISISYTSEKLDERRRRGA
jgi:transcription elongation factor Elf1